MMNIFLTGFMGSGKSTIGKKLAAHLNYQFVDMDRAIEKEENMPIPQIFKTQGETYFRNLESAWLSNYADNQKVISTGGGTPCFENNLQLMKAKGITIYLEVSVPVLAHRLYHAHQARPLIENYVNSLENLRNYVAAKLAEREAFYKKCDLIFKADDFNTTRLNELATLIKQYKTSMN
ncbi:MAG: shikimate kinase [Crocinitomicaceae bacterium]|nr:shikimate kinase [Crocinitomicaceae bacterium]